MIFFTCSEFINLPRGWKGKKENLGANAMKRVDFGMTISSHVYWNKWVMISTFADEENPNEQRTSRLVITR